MRNLNGIIVDSIFNIEGPIYLICRIYTKRIYCCDFSWLSAFQFMFFHFPSFPSPSKVNPKNPDPSLGSIFLKTTATYKVGPLPVINGVITPISRVTTPVTHWFSAIYRGPITLFITCRGPPCRHGTSKIDGLLVKMDPIIPKPECFGHLGDTSPSLNHHHHLNGSPNRRDSRLLKICPDEPGSINSLYWGWETSNL